jgi:ABC-type spermidine/putrescine transport system permease subunit II
MWRAFNRLLSPLDLYAGVIFAFLYVPIVTIAVLSFHDSPVNSLPWQGFTTKWYQRALVNADLGRAFLNSLALGITVALSAASIGAAMALAFRMPFRGKSLVLVLILLPIMTPPIVHGVSLVMFWRLNDLPLSISTSAFVGHLTFVLPFVFLTIFPRVHRFDNSLEEAAMDLGATRTQTFWRVTFPLIKPGVIAGGVLGFTLSFDEFLRTFFLTSRELTLPLFLWALVTNDLSPQSSAVATMVVLFSLGCLIIWSRFASRG